MDYLNKIKSAVSGALPGNPVSTEFDILQHVASGGPALMWKIYDGVKKSTKQEVSVFLFEKKNIQRYSSVDKDLIIDSLKKGIVQLIRLRHPKILSILHPLQESRDSLAFVTEPVFASLSNVLGNHENMPSPLPSNIQSYKLYDVEIKYGMLQVIEGLSFLHDNVKMIHNNICSNSIVLNKSGNWKLFGFDFCIPNSNPTENAPYYSFKEWNTSIPSVIQPNLNYLSPEFVTTHSNDTFSDIFSLGVLFHSVFNCGKTLYNCHEEISEFNRNVQELRNLKMSILGQIPEEIRDHVKLMLNTEPSVRPDCGQMTKIPFFDDIGVKTLQYLDSLMQRENLEKSQFFKGLPQVIAKLPVRVSIHRIIPPLQQECNNNNMVPFVLPCLLLISEQVTDMEYSKFILPVLIPLFKITDPIQVMLIFLQNMNLLLGKTPQNDIRNYVLPVLYHALESNIYQLQELVLNIIPSFASLVENSVVKNHLIPRLKNICLHTTSLNIRVQSLLCIGQLLEWLDKWYVLDTIFPILCEVPSREPAVLMSVLGIVKVASNHEKLGLPKEFIANKALPFLIPLSIDNNLNLDQFKAFMLTIKEMIAKIESEHRVKLEQLNSIQQEQRTLQFTSESAKDQLNLVPGLSSADTKDDSMMGKFMSGFGLTASQSTNRISSNGSASDKKESLPVKNGGKLNTPLDKSNLSLEEKQRVAQAQELQKRLKSSTPINGSPQIISPNPVIQKPPINSQYSGFEKAQVKDLTRTLLNDNRTLSQNKPNYHINSSKINDPSPIPFPMSSSIVPMNSINDKMSSNQLNGSYTMNSSKAVTPTQSMDLSSLDNLLGSSKPKSLNDMRTAPMSSIQNSNIGMIPQQNFMNQQNLMGNPFLGNTTFNNQPFMNSQAINNNAVLMGSRQVIAPTMVMNNTISPPFNNSQPQNYKPNKNNDLDLLF